MGYHEVPPDVLDSAFELVAWAQQAIQVAIRSRKSTKVSRPKAVRRKSARP
jgi:TfoX/Sxy family transcriptional regulator of competence genes